MGLRAVLRFHGQWWVRVDHDKRVLGYVLRRSLLQILVATAKNYPRMKLIVGERSAFRVDYLSETDCPSHLSLDLTHANSYPDPRDVVVLDVEELQDCGVVVEI